VKSECGECGKYCSEENMEFCPDCNDMFCVGCFNHYRKRCSACTEVIEVAERLAREEAEKERRQKHG
jgi:hypothetical protein